MTEKKAAFRNVTTCYFSIVMTQLDIRQPWRVLEASWIHSETI